MSYPAKTYKVHPFYKVLFDSVFEVLNNSKSPFLEWLMDKHFGIDSRNDLSKFNYNELFLAMIEQYEETLNKKTFDDIAFELRTHERYTRLMTVYKEYGQFSKNQASFVVRISPERIGQVQSMKHGRKLKDVIQMAFLNYLVALDDETMELVFNTFKQAVKES